jgi:hypothetical protein
MYQVAMKRRPKRTPARRSNTSEDVDSSAATSHGRNVTNLNGRPNAMKIQTRTQA